MGSVNLFYLENQSIAQRCVELDDDIVNMQSSINGKFDDNAQMSQDLKDLVNQVMAARGYKTYDDLQQDVFKSLTPDERQQIEATLAKFKEINDALDITFQVCLLITTAAGVVGLGIKAYDFVKSGSLTNALAKRIGQLTDVFKTGRTAATSGEKAAEEILTEVAEVAGEEAAEGVTLGAKVARFCKFVAVIGVALDIFLIGLAAYEGAQQKEELIKNVHFLNSRRVYCKIYQREAEALVNFSGQLKSVLTLMTMPDQNAMKAAIDALVSGFIKDVQGVWTGYGPLQAYQDLAYQDQARGSYLKEDLSLGEMEAEMAKDPNAPVPAPQPKSGASVATMVMSDGFIKIPANVMSHSLTAPIIHRHATFA